MLILSAIPYFIFTQTSVSLRNLIILFTSQFFPSRLLWIFYFFLLFFHLGQSCRQCFIVSIWLPHTAFLQVGGCPFFDIKCPWVSLLCPIRILLSLIYCLQLFYALSHSLTSGLIQCSLLKLFSHSLCHSEFLDGQVVVCIGWFCCGHPWHIYCLFFCLVCFVCFNSCVRWDFT